jgi:hypothetical protein
MVAWVGTYRSSLHGCLASKGTSIIVTISVILCYFILICEPAANDVDDDVTAAANDPDVKIRTTTTTTIAARVLIVVVLFIHILKRYICIFGLSKLMLTYLANYLEYQIN